MMITLVTAGFCGLLYFVLTLRVGQLRQSEKVMLGDGGNDVLLGRIRAHANFAEFVPIILILMGAIEASIGAGNELLASTGILLFLLRISHAFGMARPAPNPFRLAGAVGTWIVLVGLSIWAIVLAYGHAG
ncbi:MAPEG family protein [Glacieibacterium megasporae]|uniref:MAPEG family protein n=1 Tax=Glacieibacterium megasporae TaxID=2835787 RepID=UPI001C1DF492|nr:MAPEG family protein [Polymorphobacter megasporae]UAJ08777.1 MAPEG family protein [Polymorphobacter megasporae]